MTLTLDAPAKNRPTSSVTFTPDKRPSQVFAGNLLYLDKGKEHAVDVYVYAKGQAIGLRYGNHPRDERTHSLDYWRRQTDAQATALLEHADAFIKASQEA